jgi:hypothetical protein
MEAFPPSLGPRRGEEAAGLTKTFPTHGPFRGKEAVGLGMAFPSRRRLLEQHALSGEHKNMEMAISCGGIYAVGIQYRAHLNVPRIGVLYWGRCLVMRLLSFPVVHQDMSQGLEVAKSTHVEPFKCIVRTAFLVGHLCRGGSLEILRSRPRSPLHCAVIMVSKDSVTRKRGWLCMNGIYPHRWQDYLC